MSAHRVERLQSFLLQRPGLGVASAYAFESHAVGRHWDRVLGLAVLLDPSVHPTSTARAALLGDLADDLFENAEESRLDLVVLNDVAPTVGRRIAFGGRRIVNEAPELDRGFLRDVQVRAIDMEAFLRRPRRPRLEMASR